MACAERGMSGEGEFTTRAEDSHAVVGRRVLRREQEGRLGEIRPIGEVLHLLRGQSGAIVNDGDGVAEQGDVGEHINLAEGPRGHDWTLAKGSPVAPYPRVDVDGPRGGQQGTYASTAANS